MIATVFIRNALDWVVMGVRCGGKKYSVLLTPVADSIEVACRLRTLSEMILRDVKCPRCGMADGHRPGCGPS